MRLTTYHPCSAARQEIRGLNLPGPPWAISTACCGRDLYLYLLPITVVCKPATGPYSEAHKSNPHNPQFASYLFQFQLNVILPFTPNCSTCFFPLQFSPRYNAFISRLSHGCYMPCPGDIQSITIHVRFFAILLRTTDDNTLT